jgi:hypothetical protein
MRDMKKIFQLSFCFVFFAVFQINAQLSQKLKHLYAVADSVSAVPLKTAQLPLIGISAARTESESS